MNRKLASLISLAIVFAGMLTFAFEIRTVKAGVIFVPDNYLTIQEAVDIAASGDTIRIRGGTYDEDVIISGKSISLIGDGASNTTIRGVGKTGSNGAIEVRTSAVLIKGLTVTPKEANVEIGIYLWLESSYCTIVDNNILNFSEAISYSGNRYGINCDGADNIICRNNITNNYGGITGYNADNNLICHNNFANNTWQLYGINFPNMLDNGYEGNYWDDYGGTDNDGNGIGDTPHTISARNKDRFPLMNPWSPQNYPQPQHEIGVSIETQDTELGQSSLIKAAVSNFGNNNETNVELRILINDTVVDTHTISLLVAGSSYMHDYLWTPLLESIYNVTAHVLPVPNEKYTANNIESKMVRVAVFVARVAVLNSRQQPSYFTGGWSNNYITLVEGLNSLGFYAQAVKSEEIVDGVLNNFDIFVMVDNVPNTTAGPLIVDFWLAGGGIVSFDSSICFLCYAGILPPESTGTNGYNTFWNYDTKNQARISIEHPITAGYTAGQIIQGASSDAEYLTDILAETTAFPYFTTLVEDLTNLNMAYVLAYDPPALGKVVHIWDDSNWSRTQLRPLIQNAMNWTHMPRYNHDLAVSVISPAFVEVGNSAMLNVTVRNKGLSYEPNVELYLLINGSTVSSTLIDLHVDDLYTLSYSWTMTSVGKYNITAHVSPVPNEESWGDNTKTNIVLVYLVQYTRFYVPHQWVGGGTLMNWHADDQSWQYTLPFDFPFYGINYRDISISSNGLITFFGPDTSYSNSVSGLSGKHAIAVAWDDWMTNNPYGIYIWENATHVGIRWYVRHYGTAIVIANFEAILGVNGLIQFNYENNNGTVSATVGISSGFGHILAEDFTNLNFTDSIVFSTLIWHDVTIVSVAPSATEVNQGDTVNIDVVVRNNGNFTETFDVTTYANTTVIQIQNVADLAPGAQTTLTFVWDTTGFTLGNYTIKAEASLVSGEIYIRRGDNVKVNGAVNVIPEFPLFLIFPLFMMATLFTVIVYRRKRCL